MKHDHFKKMLQKTYEDMLPELWDILLSCQCVRCQLAEHLARQRRSKHTRRKQ